MKKCKNCRAEIIASAQDLLREIAECGTEAPPSYLCRNDYVLVEVENELWNRIQEAVK